MSLKSFTLLDELSLEGSLRKSVQGECCAASLLAGIIFEETSSIRHCEERSDVAILSAGKDCFYTSSITPLSQ